jgi:hypothetical protein
MEHLLEESHGVEGGHRVCHGRSYKDQLVAVGSRDGMGHRKHHGVVEDSRRWGHEHVVGSVHSAHGHHSSHGEVVGFCRDIRHGVGYSHVVVHGDSRPLDMGGGLENGNEHGLEEHLAGSKGN